MRHQLPQHNSKYLIRVFIKLSSLLGTTVRPTKPVILVPDGLNDLRAASVKKTLVELKFMPVPTTLPSLIIATSTPNTMTLSTIAIQDKKHKLIIPIIRPLTYTKWATYRSITVTEKARKSTGQINEGTNLQINENIIQNSNSGPETGTQIDKTEEFIPFL